MSALINLVLIVIAIYFSFKFHIILGFAAVVILAIIGWISNYPRITHGRANAEFNNRNFDKAMSLYKKAYKSGHRKYDVDISYAQALLRLGEPEKALKILNDLLGLRITKELRRPATQARCMVYYKLGRLDEAYEDALELFEDGYTTSNMYCLIGLLMLEKNEPIDKTLEFCEKAFDYDSDNRDNVDNLLVCYIKMHNLEKAKELADILTDAHPNFIEGWYHSAEVYYMLGNIEKTRDNLDHIKDCYRSYMTTVSEDEINALYEKLDKEC